MTQEALRTRVFNVVFARDRQLFAPLEWLLNALGPFLEVLDCLADSFGPFVGPQVGLTLPLEDVSVKLVEHLLKTRDEGLGMGSHLI